jgi:predicted RNase H-like HicB family nuclease/DNA-binding XRE family transcriptional regulator
MKYHFKVHKEGKGFWAECIELSGCFTQADSMADLRKNMEEALNLYIEEPEDSKKLLPFPDNSISPSRSIVEVPVDPSIAFAFLVRYNRIQQGLTQKEVAERLGFDNLYSYQRLESKKCNPSLKTLTQLKKVFPNLSVDFVLNTKALN